MSHTTEQTSTARLAARIIAAIAVLLTLWTPTCAAAQGLDQTQFETEFQWPHGVVTGVLGGSALAIELAYPELEEPNWRGPILVDDGFRNLLLAETQSGRTVAARTTDVLVGVLLGMPLAIDPAVAWLGRDSGPTGLQMAAISAEAFSVSFFVVNLLKHTVGRERPPFGECYDDPNADESCGDRPNVSFPSGHTASAFAGAGLLCVMHEQFDLYGDSAWNAVPCYAGLGAATVVAALRMTANKHYFSDVFVGGLIGVSSGYLLPKLLHFGFGTDSGGSERTSSAATVAPVAAPEFRGMTFTFRF